MCGSQYHRVKLFSTFSLEVNVENVTTLCTGGIIAGRHIFNKQTKLLLLIRCRRTDSMRQIHTEDELN